MTIKKTYKNSSIWETTKDGDPYFYALLGEYLNEKEEPIAPTKEQLENANSSPAPNINVAYGFKYMEWAIKFIHNVKIGK